MKEAIGILTATALVLYIMFTAAHTPEVRISHSTGDCVEVIPAGSCNELPEKYSIAWVE